jgi:hypothetical protein
MTTRPCPYEEQVTAAAQSGEWTAELEAHRDGCLACAELTLVVSALTTDAEKLAFLDTPLPDPAPIWMRARLATREQDLRRATRAIAWVQRAAVAVALAVGLFFAPGLWDLVRGFVSNLDLIAPVAKLPRAAGSPLLVIVMSLAVLAVLAFFELTAAHEN